VVVIKNVLTAKAAVFARPIVEALTSPSASVVPVTTATLVIIK